MTYEGSGLVTVRQLLADHQGSIVALSDGNGAATVNRYDEYGIPAATNAGRFQYTGQAWLAEIGMYYYKARIYSPSLGRFLQTDPIGFGRGMNIYAYVGNDPVNSTDPSGLRDEPIRVYCADYCGFSDGPIVVTAQRDRTMDLLRDLARIDLGQLLTSLGRPVDPGADPEHPDTEDAEDIVVTALELAFRPVIVMQAGPVGGSTFSEVCHTVVDQLARHRSTI